MILLPLLAVVVTCWSTCVALHGQWTDWKNSAITHGYLIVVLCLWLLWRKRELLRPVDTRWHGLDLAALVGTAFLWLFFTQAGIQIGAFAVLPCLFYFAVRVSLGRPTATAAAFPIFYLYSAIPVWGVVNGAFQWASVYAVRMALRAVGVPAFFEDNRVQIPDGIFEIAGGCSGLHFAVVALSIAVLLGELRSDSWRGRLRLAAIALVLAVLTNWVRIFTIILAGHYSHMQSYLVTRSHYGFGWALFAVAMTILFVLERGLPVEPGRVRQSNPRPESASVFPGAALLHVVAVLVVVRSWHWLALRPAADGTMLPSEPASWRQIDAAPSRWSPRFQGADFKRQGRYTSPDGAEVEVFAAVYRSQQQGKELGGYYNDALGGLQPSKASIRTVNGHPALQQRAHDGAGKEHLLIATYSVGNRHFARAASAQLWYAIRSLLTLRSPVSKVLLLRSECQPDCDAAANRLADIED
jgi:EpsI family protein